MSLLSDLCLQNRKRLLYGLGAFAAATLITAGVFASNGWFPQIDPLTGKRMGWFGSENSPPVLGGVAPELPSSSKEGWTPLWADGVVPDGVVHSSTASNPNAPPPSGTPQLSREYLYAGSRLLAVEDANATAAPPSDLAVWRPANGTWYVNNGTTWYTTVWGQNGDVPVPGDYDGDGKTDFSIFRPMENKWYIVYSSNSSWLILTYGETGDKTAQADYDGDGKTDPAVYRPSTGVWHIQGTSAGYYTKTWGGETGDKFGPADFDGDGRADLGIWRESNKTYYARIAPTTPGGNDTFASIQFVNAPTTASDPVASDYDGDGKADFAIYNPASATWYVRQSTTGTFNAPYGWGTAGDQAVPNDYDGDGKCDYAVWTPTGTNVGRWHIKNSGNGSIRDQVWGMSGDTPVPALYRR